MSNDDTERLVAEIDADLKARAKADPRTITEIVEASLRREFSTEETAAVERRIDEKKQRINMLERERNERNREIATEKDELSRLEAQLESFEESNDNKELEKAKEMLSRVPDEKLDATNAAVRNWAEKVNMTPSDLLEEVNND